MRINGAFFAAAAAVTVLTACNGGGGGGDAAPVETSASMTFPLAKGNANFVTSGGTYQAIASGTVNGYDIGGTITLAYGNATPSTYNGASTLSVTVTDAGTLTSGKDVAIPMASTSVYHYNPSNYMLVGGGNDSDDFMDVTSGFSALPSSVKIGDTAVVGTYDEYSDKAKTNKTRSCQVSYLVEPQGASTAVINQIDRCNNIKENYNESYQTRFSIDTFGSMKLISMTSTRKAGVLVYTVK